MCLLRFSAARPILGALGSAAHGMFGLGGESEPAGISSSSTVCYQGEREEEGEAPK